MNVVGGIGDEMEEMRGDGDDLGGGLAEVSSEFSPERVEHQLGRGFLAGVLLDALGIEVDVLASVVVSDVLLFLLGSAGPTRFFHIYLL